MMHNIPIELVQRTIAHRLLLWAGLSISLGAILHHLRAPFWQGVGITIQGGYLFLFDLVHAIWLSNRRL